MKRKRFLQWKKLVGTSTITCKFSLRMNKRHLFLFLEPHGALSCQRLNIEIHTDRKNLSVGQLKIGGCCPISIISLTRPNADSWLFTISLFGAREGHDWDDCIRERVWRKFPNTKNTIAVISCRTTPFGSSLDPPCSLWICCWMKVTQSGGGSCRDTLDFLLHWHLRFFQRWRFRGRRTLADLLQFWSFFFNKRTHIIERSWWWTSFSLMKIHDLRELIKQRWRQKTEKEIYMENTAKMKYALQWGFREFSKG